ncbi:MAG: serine/threonine transporter SstT [Bifidobacteriaceae bacterium]|nr:serine/threonine transporter SstT [Bifidobacteriaceae bacterium]
MRRVARRWNAIGLITRILVGLVVGAGLGLVAPKDGEAVVPAMDWINVLGELFVGALKALAPILVFVLVISALANARAQTSMHRILGLYLFGTFLAGCVAAAVTMAFPFKLTLPPPEAGQTAPGGIGQVLKTLATNVVANPVAALTNANYLGILAWAVMIGIALRLANDTTKSVMENLAGAIAKVVRWVINLAPFGILGLVFNAVSTSGLEIFTEYGRLLAVLVGCMLVMALVANPLLVLVVLRRNPYPLVLRCLKDSGVTAFFTRSSAANIPVNLELCRKLGLNPDTYSVSVPLGATINMAGASVTITVMALAAANTQGIAVDFPTAVVLCVLAAVSACGASGVPGGSLLLIPLACSLFGISNDVAMQMVAIGFIVGVVQDSCETALNSSSDVLFTATAEYWDWKKAGRQFKAGALLEA